MVGHKFQYLLRYIVAGMFLNDYIFSTTFVVHKHVLCGQDILACGTGLLIGSILGGFFFRGYKKWPMYIGGGLGFGMAYTNCENSLNGFLLSMDPKACIIKKTP